MFSSVALFFSDELDDKTVPSPPVTVVAIEGSEVTEELVRFEFHVSDGAKLAEVDAGTTSVKAEPEALGVDSPDLDV